MVCVRVMKTALREFGNTKQKNRTDPICHMCQTHGPGANLARQVNFCGRWDLKENLTKSMQSFLT